MGLILTAIPIQRGDSWKKRCFIGSAALHALHVIYHTIVIRVQIFKDTLKYLPILVMNGQVIWTKPPSETYQRRIYQEANDA